MKTLKERLYEKIKAWRPRTARLISNYGEVKVDEVTVSQVIGGIRDVKCLVTDISHLDPIEGIHFRGHTIPTILHRLPRVKGCEVPTVEGLYYLLLTGDIPSKQEAKAVADEFRKRNRTPKYVFDTLRALPRDTHPMAMFSTAILALQRESIFAKAHVKGIPKGSYWDPTYDDALNLLPKLAEIAAFIYRLKYKSEKIVLPSQNQDFGGSFAHMMGIGKPYDDASRLYFILHCDHENGNVSAHAAHLTNSALADIYYSISSMTNGLAGPLHGLATNEVLRWIQKVMVDMGNRIPTREEMKKFVWHTLQEGKVIPGFGHAVLRKTDPRYLAQREFCLKHLPKDRMFAYVDMLYKIVPHILAEQGKARNPWPNSDAQSGVIQWHYGIKEYDFYTVLFAVSRAFGVAANMIWARALGYSLERPKSITTAMLEEIAESAG